MAEWMESRELSMVARNCPNVTELTCDCKVFILQKPWRGLQFLPKIQRVTITNLDTYLDGSMEELKKQCYENCPELRELEVLGTSHNGG